MTHQEVYKQLELVDQQTWQQTKELLSEQYAQNRTVYINNIDISNPKPIDYFITAVIEDDCYGRQQRQSVGWGILTEKTSVFRQTHRNDYQSFLNNLPIQFIQYLPINIVNRLRKVARDEQVKSSTKKLQLNEFSYQMFKAQLNTASKKLSGNEAIAQIQKLPSPFNDLEKEYYDKFLALFWDHLPKKSIQFCDVVIGKSKNTVYTPVKVIKNEDLTNIFKEHLFSSAEVYIYLYDYQRIAKQYSIPVLREFWTDRYSDHHNWVSGVPKSTPLNQSQLEMTVSQILVLDFIITNLQKDSHCPYFTKLKTHLVSEISKPEYKDTLYKLTAQMQASYTSALKATNGLIQLHNQISTDSKSKIS